MEKFREKSCFTITVNILLGLSGLTNTFNEIINIFNILILVLTESVDQRCSVKKAPSEISQNHRKAPVSQLINMQAAPTTFVKNRL